MRKFLIRLKSGERFELEADLIQYKKLDGGECVEFVNSGKGVIAFFALTDVAGFIDHEEVKPISREGDY